MKDGVRETSDFDDWSKLIRCKSVSFLPAAFYILNEKPLKPFFPCIIGKIPAFLLEPTLKITFFSSKNKGSILYDFCPTQKYNLGVFPMGLWVKNN